MINIKIKITGLSVDDKEATLDLNLEDAKKLYDELGKVFREVKITGVETPLQIISDGKTNWNTFYIKKGEHRIDCMCTECSKNNMRPLANRNLPGAEDIS